MTRKERSDASVRSLALATCLAADGTLSGGLNIPGSVAPLMVTADLRASKVSCHVDVDAPREGRPQTRVNWLLRQLKEAPDDLRVEAFVMHGRGNGTAELLGAVRESPKLLIADPSRDIRAFRIASNAPMGTKRGRGRGGFIDSVAGAVNGFYADVVQNLRGWQPLAPKLRELVPEDTEQAVEEALVSTALSSQDEPETSDATAAVRQAVRSRIAGDTLPDYVAQNGSRWATDL
jgi:hypothetical protein